MSCGENISFMQPSIGHLHLRWTGGGGIGVHAMPTGKFISFTDSPYAEPDLLSIMAYDFCICLFYYCCPVQAVSMDSVEENSLTSSMVDDVFFVVKKCIRSGTCSFDSISISRITVELEFY